MRQKLYPTTATQAARTQAYCLIGLQLIVTISVALCWEFVSSKMALSAFLGGACCVLPNFYFAMRFFASGGAREPRRIIRAFYWGEFLKLLLSASLVIIVLSRFDVKLLPFFTGFIGAHMGFWLAPVLAVTESRVAS